MIWSWDEQEMMLLQFALLERDRWDLIVLHYEARRICSFFRKVQGRMLLDSPFDPPSW